MSRLFKAPRRDLVSIHPDNLKSKDWIVLLEATTVIGPSRRKLRVALATLERKTVTKYNFWMKSETFLVLEGYDPRIHVLYFCPQLYRQQNNQLTPLEGYEIGELLARTLEKSAVVRHPWYEPSLGLPQEPAIQETSAGEFDSLVIEGPIEEPTFAPIPTLTHGRSTASEISTN